MSVVVKTKMGLFTKFVREHETIASILAIVASITLINNWLISDIRSDTRETNKRIDNLYHFVLSGKPLKDTKQGE